MLKVKTNTARGIEPARIVHEAAPHACLILDPNQDWSIAALERFAPRLPDIGVILLEQPTRVGDDAHLSRLTLPVLVACDESFTDSDSMRHSLGATTC